MSDDKPPGVIGVATGGIQDVSALLPLLGTDQCETHVASALQRGYLYAAAAPISIFGSLGVVKAGVVVLWASIDKAWFSGPASLRNAGFRPSGIGGLLSLADGNSAISNVEEKIHRMLGRKAIRSVQVNMWSSDFWAWNIRLTAVTLLLSGLGLLPYTLLIYRLPERTFKNTWIYPVSRILGCALVTICIQIIFQLRILEQAYCRIRFLATDGYLKREGYKEFPQSWDSNQRSADVLTRFQRHVYENGSSTFPLVKLAQALEGLGTMTSLDLSSGEAYPTSNFPYGGDVNVHHISGTYTILAPTISNGYQPAKQSESNFARNRPILQPRPMSISPVAILLCFAQMVLFASICAAVVGYVGCFTVVQASPRSDSIGPAIWLLLEASLAVLRTALWAWNPVSDDAKPPIALHKISIPDFNRGTAARSTSGVKWDLDSATTDDIRAVVVGVGDYRRGSSNLDDTPESVEAARSFETYLKVHLRVPHDQVVALYDADAKKERILDEIKRLVDELPTGHYAPVVVYLSTYSFLDSGGCGRLLTHPPEGQLTEYDHCSLQHASLVDLLQKIAREKTDNITLILDCCFAGIVLRPNPESLELQFKAPDVHIIDAIFAGIWVEGELVYRRPTSKSSWQAQYQRSPGKDAVTALKLTPGEVESPSHILISTSRGRLTDIPAAGRVGKLTASLLAVLKDSALQTMTYGGLMANVLNIMQPRSNQTVEERDAEEFEPRDFNWADIEFPIWTKTFANRLLLDGLFARRIEDEGSSPVITVLYDSG